MRLDVRLTQLTDYVTYLYLIYLLSSPYHGLNSQVVYPVNLSSCAFILRITEYHCCLAIAQTTTRALSKGLL